MERRSQRERDGLNSFKQDSTGVQRGTAAHDTGRHHRGVLGQPSLLEVCEMLEVAQLSRSVGDRLAHCHHQ